MTEPENRQRIACLFLLGMTLGVASNINAHGGDPARIHACVRQSNGSVRFVPPDDDCSELNPPGAWLPVHWDVEGGDNDWAGAGTGSLHPFSLSDSVVVGAESASAKLHVRTAATEGAAALRIDPRGTQGLLVDSQGNLLIGASSGSLARLTVNAEEHADAFRARVGGITHFVIKADGQTGLGIGEPSARLEVAARQGEEPFRVRLQSAQPEFIIDAHGNVGIGTHEPTDKLAVLQEGDGRAASFSIENPTNDDAAVSAITNGTGLRSSPTSSTPTALLQHCLREPLVQDQRLNSTEAT